MGCNTSKETVPAAEDKGKQENGDVGKVGEDVENTGESFLAKETLSFVGGQCGVGTKAVAP